MRYQAICAFGYYGAKNATGGKYRKALPVKKILMEPFAGSAAILLNSPGFDIRIANDRDKNVSTFHRVMADPKGGKALVQTLITMERKREIFMEAHKKLNTETIQLSEMERAVATFVVITQSFNAMREQFSTGNGSDEYIRRNRNMLWKVYERMQGVRVYNKKALEIMEPYLQDADCLIFLDPPYLPETRSEGARDVYPWEMTREEHIEMLETIKQSKASIMLCGFREKGDFCLYDSILLPCGWKCYKVGNFAKPTGGCMVGQAKPRMVEFIWINYEIPINAKQDFVLVSGIQ